MRRLRPAVHVMLLGSFLAVALGGCKSRAPAAADIGAYDALRPFLVAEAGIEGVYQNVDVDSLVFTYTTSAADEDSFWERLHQNLEGSRWHELAQAGAVRQFERTYRRYEEAPGRAGSALYASAELLRIAYVPTTRKVIVGYVQGDSSEDEVAFLDTDESRWADRNVWPIFERQLP